MVTIYDISKQTGFSPPTVSKALTGAGTISLKTRNHIIATAREMGYEPNLAARTLRTKRSRLIGILNKTLYRENNFGSPFLSPVLGSFKESMAAEDYDLLYLSDTLETPGGYRSTGTNYRHIDGMIIISIESASDGELKALSASAMPCVAVNDTISGIPMVFTDNRKGGRAAVQHLIDIGRRRIAYISGPISRFSLAAEERRQGYRDCLLRNNIAFDKKLIVSAETWHALDGYKACWELLARKVPFDAIFAACNHLAFGAIRYLYEQGFKVPEDIAVIGFDDGDGLEAYITPSLSTMRQDAARIGKTAAEMLLRKLGGEKTEKRILIPAELIPRESTVSRLLP
jgi:LacI family transcriptional regulator